jgi:hypothetical protein
MKPARIAALLASHVATLAAGFALGIYALPLLTAPASPTAAEVQRAAEGAAFSAEFKRGLAGSDALHWGEGRVSVGAHAVTHQGRLAPGPAYRLYLTPELVDTEADFERVKAASVALGDIKTFDGFIVPVPAGVDVARYRGVLVWCEAFSQFITAAAYR